MIVIPRGLARSVRALARRCVAGRPRGPAPPVVLEAAAGTLTAWTGTAGAALVHAAPTPCEDGVLIVPMAVFDAVAGSGGGPVELTTGPGLRGEARFVDRGVPRDHPFDAIPPGPGHRPPAPPAAWHPVPSGFLTALHECGRTAAKESGRYALARVQVRGTAGLVIGTDGRTALVWGGFDLPYREDVLVPALPVFGASEFAAGTPVRLGRTATHLVVASGPWRVDLPVDPAGRYPDVAGLVPRTTGTVAALDERDAADLAARLRGLPGAAADGRPVTLALGRAVTVQARDGASGRAEAVRLDRSTAAGPEARAAVDRQVLARALALGCHTVRVAGGRPVVFEGRDVRLLAVSHEPGAEAARPDTPTPTERRTAVRHDPTGPPAAGRPDPAADPPDPLAAAEELRAVLADAAAKAGRLVAALKSRKREQKALTQAWSSLRALNLDPEGRP